ncbi:MULTISPECIES: hypothetical protein [Flavobacterium]|uniref:hypothetical protein n=1 Tax=Flavobacterium TaxID=237 RepID=UPI001182B6FD|nr:MULTISPECIES: hypothetical protein [Flavobacterium]MCR4033585.1 hypothetical protein [Flavobacterium panacis]
MKTYVKLTLSLWCLVTMHAYSQVGMTTNTPNKNAALDLNNSNGSNTKGLLLPKVALTSTASASPMTTHVAGMKVYNTATSTGTTGVTPGLYINDGTKWIRSETDSNLWSITGNAGTSATTNFLGTTDAKDFVVKTNNTEQMRVASTGQILIGTSTVPTGGTNAKLIIDNGNKGGAIQLLDGTQADGATLMSDANGVAKWFQGGNNDLGTGIYNSTTAQTFNVGTATVLQTNKAIKVSEPGNYMVSLRWWGATDTTNAAFQVEADIGLNKNGVQVDFLQQYETKLSVGRICFTTNLVATNCLANDVLTITVKANIGGKWYTGTVDTTKTNWMPSVMVVKL